MEKVIANANRDVVYQALPKFPALTRDIAMLVKEDVTVKEIADIIKKNGGAYLKKQSSLTYIRGHRLRQAINLWHIPSPSAVRKRHWQMPILQMQWIRF